MARSLAPCGTLAAARRHRRNGEPLCDACREAQRLDGVKRRAKAAGVNLAPLPAPDPHPHEGLDRERELLEMYQIVKAQALGAPVQSLASLIREMRAVLDALTQGKEEARTSEGGDALDEIAARRAHREANA